MPLRVKVVSTMTEPEKMLRNQEMMTVMTGSSALRQAWE